MSSDLIERDPVVVERLMALVGATKLLQNMVGNDDQSWLAENVAEAKKKGVEAAAEVFKIAVQNVHASISKFTLLFKDATKPNEVGNYAEEMEKALVGLVQTSQTLLLVRKSHQLLKNSVNKLVLDILNVTIKLAEDMSTNKIPKGAAHSTGQVWASCDALEAMNFDQSILEYCDALFKTQATALREAVQELEEALEEADDDADVGADEEEEDQDSFLDFSFSAADRKILPGCILILKAVNSFTTQLKKIVTGLNDETIFHVYSLCQQVFSTIDDFSTSIYPPQVVDDVLTHVENFKKLQQSIATSILDSNPPQETRDLINKLQTAVNGIFDKATEMIRNP